MGVNKYVEVELKVQNQKIKDENQFIDSLLKDDEKALLYELLIEYNEDEKNVKIDDNNEKTGDKMITSTTPLNDNYGWIENLHSNYQNSASSTSSFVFCFDINYSKQISSLGFNFNYHHSTIDTSDNIVFPVISQVSNLLKVVIQPGDVIIKINDKKLIEIVNRSNLNKEDYNIISEDLGIFFKDKEYVLSLFDLIKDSSDFLIFMIEGNNIIQQSCIYKNWEELIYPIK